MPNSNDFQKVPTVDFTPARLYQGKEWVIQFKVRDPHTNRLRRVRYKWNQIANLQKRKTEGLKMCEGLTQKLYAGWNPLIEANAQRTFLPLKKAIDDFLAQVEQSVKEKAMRPDTLRSYRSFLKNFQLWLGYNYKKWSANQLTFDVIDKFLVHIHLERGRTARTRNNYLSFFIRLGTWFVQKKYLANNPAIDIPKLPESKKRRTVIPRTVRKEILAYLKENNSAYWTMALSIYYTFVRRTELTKLRVKHVNLIQQTLFVPGEYSKNGRDHVVTIPEELGGAMIMHLKKAFPGYYLFSDDNFLPGPTPLTPKKVSDRWAKMRKQLELPAEYQFYSLKDTGITEMLRMGIPPIVVRDQARHHDISVTDLYTPRETQKANPQLMVYSQNLNPET